MGSIEQVMGMLPKIGPFAKIPKDAQVDEKQLKSIEAIINSMTAAERDDANLIDGKRRKRIARGSGTSVQEVNQVLKQYADMRRMMKQYGSMAKMKMRGIGKFAGLNRLLRVTIVPIIVDNTLNQIRSIAMGGDGRAVKAQATGGDDRQAGRVSLGGRLRRGRGNGVDHRMERRGGTGESVIPGAKGLTGAAIQEKRAVICGDVRPDRRYLRTFGSTLSEIIVPVLSPGGGHVIGTVDVESDQLDMPFPRPQISK